MEKVAVCLIAKNEADRIGRCLASVSWADEIIVVLNAGPKDNTEDVARQHGAKVFYSEWNGWAKQKNFSIDKASCDWILSLDADEWLPENSEAIIRKALEEKPDSYTLGRRTTFLGKWIRHSGWYPDRQIRLFRKSATRFADVPVHEKVEETPLTADLPLDIWHESYVTLQDWETKNTRYTEAQAKQQIDQKFVGLKLIAKPVYRFIQTYIFQAGFLDGWRGLQLAGLRAAYEFSVCRQILALRRTKR